MSRSKIGLLLSIVLLQTPTFAGDIEITCLSFDGVNLDLEIQNTTNETLRVIDKLDVKWGVIRLNIVDEKDQAVKVGTEGVDWVAFPDDAVNLKPKESLVRALRVSLKPGKYKVSATYEVQKDSFFIDAWFDKGILPRGKFVESKHKLMTSIWFGTAISKSISVVVGEPKKTSNEDESKK